MEPRALESGVAMGRDEEIRQEDKLMTFENVECVPGIGHREGEVSFVDSLMGIMKNTEGLGIDGGVEGQSRGREDKRYKSRTWRSGGEDGKRQGFLAALRTHW